jgi:excisionase family DNA binding protein
VGGRPRDTSAPLGRHTKRQAADVPQSGGCRLPVRTHSPQAQAEKVEPHPERLLSPEELAGVLNVSRQTAYRLVWGAQIPSIKVGKLRRIRAADVERYIDARLEHASRGS